MKNFVFGYRRVSTDLQSLDRQLAGVECDRVFDDVVSGRSTGRPQLQRLLDSLREGDTVVVHSIDRLARSTSDLFELVKLFKEKKCILKFHTEGITFGGQDDMDPRQEFMFTMMAAVATMENALIRERRKEGIDEARKNGKYKGKQRMFRNEKLESLKAIFLNTLVPVRMIAKKFDCSEMTIINTLRYEGLYMKKIERKMVFEEKLKTVVITGDQQ
jgi:DNA invertase Pin-like site-specific DNA recombinase